MTKHTVYLALGANIGDRRTTMLRAIDRIKELIGTVERQSVFYETEPWGFASPHRFLNACVRVSTTLSPRQLLAATQQIERVLGRMTKSADGVYHDRVIDIDILLYDDLRVDEPDLKIPHPLMTERDFVMIPLREILG
ncbi:MAG: 2-amino-4-hydroxy-6-hydroxymethyldihydropteridine diphosphokinase [Prevotellaceae bacterium]|nr:2-amino-4-hydroxy-6-hydroxymethyldihydropteridine diphosphokinase [Prevotella sp.]MDD7605818.1 2-amino-4-hydroxy-6-hydroxymethyldihydropteridine diphosphokinase [Prevotellaceae bacterium]